MKKLMKTVVASAVALVASGAFATLPSPTANFSGIATGEKTVSDLVANSQDKYWFAITNSSQELSGAIGIVTNDSNEVARGNFLKLDAQAPVYRAINEVSGDGYGAEVGGLTTESIGVNGIYLDTWVKFSVSSDDDFKDLDIGVDKLAITCYSPEVNENESSETNILVRAGYVAGSTITATNYTLNLPQNFNIDEWHRLTVRAIADVGYNKAPVGFAIYLDEELLKYSTSVAAGEEETYENSLNAAVVQNLYNSETHALLPSLIDYTYNDCSVLSAVGFKGSGSVDDILFTNNKPSFIVEGQSVTIAWDAGVKTYTVVDSNNKKLVDAASTSGAVSTNLTLDAGVTYLTVTATYADGYEAGTWTKSAGTLSNDVWTFAENGATLTIVSMLPKFDVGGAHYGSFTEALAAAVSAGTEVSPATIKLMGEVSETMSFTEGYIILDLNGKTIHAGASAKFVVANSGATLTIVDTATGGILESGSTGSVRVYGDTAFTTIEAGTYEGTIVVTGQDEAQPEDVLVVRGGRFYDEDYADDHSLAFYLTSFVDTATCTISNPDANDYFTVTTSEPPTPTTYEVTWTLTGGTTTATSGDDFVENATIVFTANTDKVLSFVSIDGTEILDTSVYGASSYTYTVGTADAVLVVTFSTQVAVPTAVLGLVYDGSEKTGVAAGAGYTLSGNTATAAGDYTATATLDAGCVWSDDYTTADKSINWSIAAKSVTVTVTLDPASATLDSSKTTAGAYTTVSVSDGVDTLTVNTDYTVAGLDAQVSAAGTYTITVSAVSGGNYAFAAAEATLTITAGGSYPSYIDDPTKQEKYDTWKSDMAAAGVDVGDGADYEDAYLLNCKPAEVDAAKAAFKFTSISYDTTESKWVTTTTTGYNERTYNGTVTVTGYSDVGCTVQNAAGPFFKATLD